MKFKNLLFFALLIATSSLNAQTDFRPGYVIKNSGDTLYGMIDYRGDQLMSGFCTFKTSENVVNEFTPKDILAYRFTDSKYYVTREIDGRKIFLEYLIKGKVNMYYMRDANGDHYYLDRDNIKISELPYEEGIKWVGKEQVFYKTNKHIGLLYYYMQDAPEFKSQIDRIIKPEHKNLVKLAEDYHNAVCKGESCIVYEKAQPLLKINLEMVGGMVNYETIDDLNDKFYFQGGVLAHFWIPRLNEKFFIKTGFLYSQIEDLDGKKYNYFIIPAHIGYLAPKAYRIRPTLSIGMLSPSYSGGLIVKLNKSISIGVQSWMNFNYDKFPFIPSTLYSYSLFGNLYIEM